MRSKQAWQNSVVVSVLLTVAVLFYSDASLAISGNRWLKRTLAQATWAASHTKNTYLASQYRRLAGRRGRKRALIAVGHSILVIFYHMLKGGTRYTDLGGDFFDRLEPQRMTRYYVRRLESLGHNVTRESYAAA